MSYYVFCGIYKQHVSSFNYAKIQTTRAVLVAISIPIFTSQLEKARDATDEANIRSAIAEVSAAVLTDEKKPSGNVTYTDTTKTYSMTVGTTGTTAGWTGAADENASIKIGGVDVAPSQNGWTVSGTSEGTGVTVASSK